MTISNPTRILLGFFVVIACVEGCTKSNGITPPTALSLNGHFTYKAYSADSLLVATGTLDMTQTDSVISGNCTVQPVDTSSNSAGAFEAGTHTLSGTISKQMTFLIYLDPEKVTTVYIQGTLAGASTQGPRYLITGGVATPRSLGYYSMQKQ
jgi:hypothetical protein